VLLDDDAFLLGAVFAEVLFALFGHGVSDVYGCLSLVTKLTNDAHVGTIPLVGLAPCRLLAPFYGPPFSSSNRGVTLDPSFAPRVRKPLRILGLR